MKDLAASSMTMLCVAPRKWETCKVDKVVFMADGKILEIDTPENIFSNPKHEKTKEIPS